MGEWEGGKVGGWEGWEGGRVDRKKTITAGSKRGTISLSLNQHAGAPTLHKKKLSQASEFTECVQASAYACGFVGVWVCGSVEV